MGNLRCPVCAKTNKDDAIVCEFCGARLDPVTGKLGRPEGAGRSAPPSSQRESGNAFPPMPDWLGKSAEEPSDSGLPGEDSGDGEELPDWLGGLEDRIAEAEEAEAGSPSESLPDWFGRLGEGPAAQAQGPAPSKPPIPPPDQRGSRGEAPGAPSEPGEPQPSEGLPAWLQRLRQRQAAEPKPEHEPAAEGAGETALRRALLREPPPVTQPLESPSYDWLEKLRARRESEEAPPPEPEQETLPQASVPGGPDSGKRETPQWLDGLREASSGVAGPPPGQIPDWLVEFAQESGIENVGAAATPSWLQEIQPEAPALESGVDLTPPAEGWLEELAREDAGEPQVAPGAPVPGWMEELAKLEEDLGEPKRKPGSQAFRQPDLPVREEVPREPIASPSDGGRKPRASWMEELAEAPASAEALPRIPALMAGIGEESPAPREEALDLEAIQLPDWLGDVQPAGPPAEAAPAEAAPSLAPATLPAWLEAMRPVETFRPVAEVPEEEDTSVESAGPLAGLRGLLLAEPVVAMPRSGALTGSRLDITERQYAQAELLRRMVEEEQRELPAPRPAAARPPLLRWLVGVFLVSMVALPLFWEGPVFSRPAPDAEGRVRLPIELAPLAEMVNTLPAEKPVLMAFDYDAGYAGELEPVAGALVEHIVLRGLRIVTVSTQQTGPLLAERLIQRIGSAREYTVGRDYLHLGYLAGGPAALQLLVADPRLAGLAGFYPRGEGYTDGSVWDSPVLQGAQRLSDFGLVVVITSGSQQARMWAEQVGPGIGEVPLAMVLSAGVEPMVRPYFDAADRQVDAILSGLPSAVKYEQLIQIPAIAAARWDTFGTGMMAAEILLIAGAAYGLFLRLLRPRGA